jgi:hypothetical protein
MATFLAITHIFIAFAPVLRHKRAAFVAQVHPEVFAEFPE